MGFLSAVSSLFHSRDKPQNRIGGRLEFLFGPTDAGKIVNERTSMQVTAVYACVRILSEAVASLPLHVFEEMPDGSRERRLNHPLCGVLRYEPNPEMTHFVFWETLISHLLLYGNCYAQIIRDGRGQVTALYPLLPDRIDISRRPDGKLIYMYYTDMDDRRIKRGGTQISLNDDEVFHVPGLGFDGLIGYSPIAVAKNAIGMAMATEEFGSRFFANGARPGGVIEHPKTIKDPGKVRESWNSMFQGGGNSNKVAVLEEGMTYRSIGVPPEEAQFLESRKFQISEIARIFRIPPHMLGDLDRATYNNIENLSIDFVKYTLDPWITRLEDAIRKDLFLPSEKGRYYAKFNVDGLLRGAYRERMEGYRVGIQNGFLSPNDVRAYEDMQAIEDGDVYAMNGNMVKLADIGIAYRKNE